MYSTCLSAVLSFSLSLKGVARLADISLHDPVSISVLDESHDVSSPESEAFLEASPPQATDELDGFAIPAGLEQHVVVVPSKLRLVCLAAFILQKCKVGLRAGPDLILKGPQCCLCQAWRAAGRGAHGSFPASLWWRVQALAEIFSVSGSRIAVRTQGSVCST